MPDKIAFSNRENILCSLIHMLSIFGEISSLVNYFDAFILHLDAFRLLRQ